MHFQPLFFGEHFKLGLVKLVQRQKQHFSVLNEILISFLINCKKILEYLKVIKNGKLAAVDVQRGMERGESSVANKVDGT